MGIFRGWRPFAVVAGAGVIGVGGVALGAVACGPISAAPDASAFGNDGGGREDDGGGSDGGTGDARGQDASANAKFASVTGGHRTTCAVYNDGRLFCFGGNDSGQLGDGTTGDRGGEPGTMATLKPVDLGPGALVKQVVLGDSHVCALLAGGRVKCWGTNEQGQLGLEDNVDRGDKPGQMGDALPAVNLGTGRSAVKLAGGLDFTCALLDNASVKCWGRNANGQLGQGTNAVFVGRAAGEMGNGLPAVDLGAGRTVKDIGAGEIHACALLDDDTMKCWGGNQSGQLGYQDVIVRGRQPGTMGANLAPLALGAGRKVRSMFVGFHHNCATLDNDSLKCWGANNAGQLGLGSVQSYGATAGTMGDTLPVVSFGTGRGVVSMALGELSTCALLDDGTVKCVGDNSEGQLGYGDTLDRGTQANTAGDNLPALSLGSGRKVDLIGGGTRHTCAAFDDKSLRCWGKNTAGQLGVGDRNVRGDTPGEMGVGLTAAELP